MKSARTFHVALARELRGLLRSPGFWVAALLALVPMVALLEYLEGGPRSTGENFSLSLMTFSTFASSWWMGTACIPLAIVLTRSYGARLRRLAAFSSSRPVARRTAARARAAALLIVALGVFVATGVAVAAVSPGSTRSEVPVVLYLDMLKAKSGFGEVELSFPNDGAAKCFDDYEARVMELPDGCHLFAVDVLEETAPFVFLSTDDGLCLNEWAEQGCGLHDHQFSTLGERIVDVVEKDRECLERWGSGEDRACRALARMLLVDYIASHTPPRSRWPRRPDPGAISAGHRVTLVKAAAEHQHCADAWASSYRPLRDACYRPELDRDAESPEEELRAQELAFMKPRAFVHGVPAAIQIGLSAGLWVLFWSLFGTAVGLRPPGVVTSVAGLFAGGLAWWIGTAVGGPVSKPVILGGLCLAAYTAMVSIWTKSDLG